MATRIVSWGDSKHITSPVNSSKPSIVSIDSIQTSLPSQHMSSVLTEPSGSETLTPASTYPRADAADTSFERHQKYFFKDGNVTFLVDGTLYCVHRYFFSRDSEYFSTRFAQLGIHDHEALPITISLGNIERKDFDAFLSILYPENFEKNNLSYNEWRSVLHLSTQWDFASIRRLALNNLQPPTPHDRLLLARTYLVDHWVTPALSALCERSAPLSLDEARQMIIEDVVLVATVREDIRNHALRVDAAQIPRLVEIAQAGKLVRVDSVEVPSVVPTSGAVEQESLPVAEKRASKDYDTEEVDGEVPVNPVAVRSGVVSGSAATPDDKDKPECSTKPVLRLDCIREPSIGVFQEKAVAPEGFGVWTKPAQLMEVTRPKGGAEDVRGMGGKAPECMAEEAVSKARAKDKAEARARAARRAAEITERACTADRARRGVPRSADDDTAQSKVKKGLDEWIQRFS